MEEDFCGLVRTGKIEHRKGDLVMARMDGPRWWRESVGVVIGVVAGAGSGEAVVTAVLDSGMRVELDEGEFDRWFMTFPNRIESMFIMCYGVASEWQVDEDFHAGRFQLAFEDGKRLAQAVVQARRSRTLSLR